MKYDRTGFVNAGGKNLYFELLHREWLGEGSPLLIFLHEGLGSIAQWKDFPITLSFQSKIPALVYDRYGYGRSEALSGPRYPRFLHDEALIVLPELLGKLGLERHPRILVGHSDGGTIALIHAGAFPGMAMGVITEAAHVIVEPDTVNGLSILQKESEDPKFMELLSKYHGDKTQYLVSSWIDNWLSPEAREWNVEEYLPGITCPVLAIQGTEDNFGSQAQLESIESKVSGTTEIVLIGGCGHIPHKQARDIVLKKMLGFISTL